jgi:diguanylate cyclase (GGDEF)-like protein
VQQRIRKVDILCRFGGEEFVLLLTDTTSANASHLAEELRRVVERSSTLHEGGITISVGVCDVAQAQDLEDWFKLADGALYQAKRNGRNRVEVATSLAEPVVAMAETLPHWR